MGAAALLLCAPIGSVSAQQSAACRVPDPMPVPRPVPIPRGEAVQASKVGGYILSLSWSPQYCASVREPDSERNRDQCAVLRDAEFWARASPPEATYAWVLHGLWPQSADGPSPRWCRTARIVPKEILRQNFCVSPSVHLMQHQWAKHGSCMSDDPAAYFRMGAELYGKIGFPDMAILAGRPQNSSAIRRAFALRNSGTTEHMFSVHTDGAGWLREVRLCLNLAMRPVACAADQQGLLGPRQIMIRPAKS